MARRADDRPFQFGVKLGARVEQARFEVDALVGIIGDFVGLERRGRAVALPALAQQKRPARQFVALVLSPQQFVVVLDLNPFESIGQVLLPFSTEPTSDLP